MENFQAKRMFTSIPNAVVFNFYNIGFIDCIIVNQLISFFKKTNGQHFCQPFLSKKLITKEQYFYKDFKKAIKASLSVLLNFLNLFFDVAASPSCHNIASVMFLARPSCKK
jgi:hypothetical protein